jgi:DNA anti-recombination protein RmuC
MKNYFLSKAFILKISVLLIIVGFVFTSQSFAEATTMSDVKKELAEALEAIKNYSAERKTDALAAMKETLAQMDQQIDQLRDKINKQWEEMEPEARKKADETMQQLQRQRDKTADAIEELRKSGEKTWNSLKEEFMKNYEKFKNEFEDGLTYL